MSAERGFFFCKLTTWLILQTLSFFTSIMMSLGVAGISAEEGNVPFEEAHTVEQYVKAYFVDIPVMAEIARCESTFRHYNSGGNVLRGVVNSDDVGVMQINEYYHGDTADVLGLDLYTLQGNLQYARDLYEREGTTPWNASKPCWGDVIVAKK